MIHLLRYHHLPKELFGKFQCLYSTECTTLQIYNKMELMAGTSGRRILGYEIWSDNFVPSASHLINTIWHQQLPLKFNLANYFLNGKKNMWMMIVVVSSFSIEFLSSKYHFFFWDRSNGSRQWEMAVKMSEVLR